MKVSQVLLSDCLNLNTVVFFLSALSSSTVKAQMSQWGHLGRHSLVVRGDSARLSGCVLPPSSWPFFFFSSVVLFMTRQEIHKRL